MASGKRYEPITLPPKVAGDLHHVWRHGVYCYRWVTKISSKKVRQPRALLTTSLLLLQMKEDGTITRVMPLDEIESLEWDGEEGRVALRATKESRERDWLFEWLDRPDNSHTEPEDWTNILNQCRDPLVPVGAPSLEWKPFDKSRRLRMDKTDGMSPPERLAMYQRKPSLLPSRRKPRGWSQVSPQQQPQQQQPQQQRPVQWAGQRVRYNITLQHADEPLGIDYMHRIFAESGNGGVFVTRVKAGGAAERHGMTNGRILQVAGAPIHTAQDLHDVIRQIYGERMQEFSIDIGQDDEADEELGALNFTRSGTLGGAGVPLTYRVMLNHANEPLGLEYRAERYPDDPAGKVKVVACDPGGASDRAGLPLSQIVSIDGRPIHSSDDLTAAVGAARSREQPEMEFVMLVPPAEIARLYAEHEEQQPPMPPIPPAPAYDDPYDAQYPHEAYYEDSEQTPTAAPPVPDHDLAGLQQRDLAELQQHIAAEMPGGGDERPMDPEEAFARKLHELATLRRKGRISDADYAVSKKRLLQALSDGSDDADRAAPQRRPPPAPWARVNINRYVFLREHPQRGSRWVPGGGVTGTLQAETVEGDFARVLTKEGRRGWLHTRYVSWVQQPEQPQKSQRLWQGDAAPQQAGWGVQRELAELIAQSPRSHSSWGAGSDDGHCPSCGRRSPPQRDIFTWEDSIRPQVSRQHWEDVYQPHNRFPRLSALVRGESSHVSPQWPDDLV
eukprot:TRINITY_DN836_c0_g1_i1.p1 TRINITY_DN836_c0_g1~~TRINITY_DN836_c0_g1_i1.p1  ORF type:complete len:751 (+),score=241.52 TRINITY_DN836_c0_g1_i1:71-2254(+)